MMNVDLKGVWFAAARPLELEDMVLPVHIAQFFKGAYAKGDIPHMLFSSSSPGTGKTTLAKIITRHFNTEILTIRGSLDLDMDSLRNEVERFVCTKSMKNFVNSKAQSNTVPWKIVFIDEADGINHKAQEGLRHILEDYESSARFILTANYDGKFISPLMSRLVNIKFDYSKDDYKKCGGSFLERVSFILDSNNIKYANDTLARIYKNVFPDLRSFWNQAQFLYNCHGEICTNDTDFKAESVLKLIEIIKQRDYKVILDNVLKMAAFIDYNTIYSDLFKNIDLLKSDFDLLKLSILLAKGQDMNFRAIDKQLNFMGFIAELLYV